MAPPSVPELPSLRPLAPWNGDDAGNEQRLLGAAEIVLRDWALLAPRRAIFAPSTQSNEDLHAVATLVGPKPGLLCASASARLGSMLALAGNRNAWPSAEALLPFSARLREAFLGDRGQLQPAAHWSLADDLPAHTPQAQLFLIVAGYPLQLRFWLD